ncbi:nucleotide exchange factor GrpE [candidate division KSB3 bacterium]|uniref:Protein GrpE n=1 Tax=candidate division KSB3 bacterium TaxID=2044937 RepID=A0A2G6E659_9BACT|nr:MAG: nucleotide exchange factor GrpE [candidate division KSB3 bacterium]PIE29730.1 MAG: nucleotide exchange factor GrpE [candidate division KSB3 bacterium]
MKEESVVKIPVHKEDDHTQDESVDETPEQETLPESEGGDIAAHSLDDEVSETAEQSEAESDEQDEESGDELSKLQAQLTAKEQEAKDHYDARLRLQAEFDNFKKRKEKESIEVRKYANEDFIRELLVVVDDFDRAIASAEQTQELSDFLKGVEMISEKFLGVLKKRGVSEIKAKGQQFNPEIHEAVTQIETDDMEEGTVAAVFQKGYYLHDRVVIPPKVGVAKHK